jgi:4'-phosphopantetheinyl transferase
MHNEHHLFLAPQGALPMHALGPQDVHVWLSFYDGVAGELEAMRSLLSEAEIAQAARYHAEDDRKRHLVTRALVRTVLSRYAPVRPTDWRFTANAHGRPEIAADMPEAGGLRFNLSHTRGLIALAVSRRDVGVDVECVNARAVSPSMAQRFFTPEEAAALARVPADQQQLRFFEYWTFKEAYIKARGRNLTFPLDRFSLEFVDERSVRLRIDPELRDDPARWHLSQFRPTPDYVLALCTERLDGDTPQISLHEAADDA